MLQPQQIDGSPFPCDECFDRSLGALVGKIAQERVAPANGKETEFDTAGCVDVAVSAIDHFVGGAVSTDREEFAITLCAGFGSKLRNVPWPSGGDHVHTKSTGLQTRERFTGELRRSPATRR